MDAPATLQVLRVFCDEDSRGGNPLGVFLDGRAVPEGERQAVARDLGFAETVYVDDRATAALRIFTPEVELPLAGHPLVGTAWLLRELGEAPTTLQPPAGEVGVRFEDELVHISADPEWGPPFEFVEFSSPRQVDDLQSAPAGYGEVGVWAWLDREQGLVRERVFVPELGIEEDEATGSAALRLAAELGRPIVIHQGAGSVLWARPLDDGRAEVGGRVVLDDEREYSLPAG